MSDAAKNFFISYSRTGDAESGLAHFLRDELIRENYRVFLDVLDIPPGTDWGKEIDSRIGKWCRPKFVGHTIVGSQQVPP